MSIVRYPIEELVKDKGYWYLATPYSKWIHGLPDANLVAQKLAAQIMYKNVPVYSPIAYTHGIATAMVAQGLGIDLRDHEYWMAMGKPLVMGAFGLLVADLAGWRDSWGVTLEIQWCRETKKPIWLIDPDTLEVRALT